MLKSKLIDGPSNADDIASSQRAAKASTKLRLRSASPQKPQSSASGSRSSQQSRKRSYHQHPTSEAFVISDDEDNEDVEDLVGTRKRKKGCYI